MMKKTSYLLVTVIAMIIAQTAFADTHYVSLAGGNIPPYTNGWASAATNIQDAITNALTTTGDTVLVSNGVYQTGGTTNYPAGSLLTNRVVITKAITVRSLNNDPTNTIIKGVWDPLTTNGPAAVRCVYIKNLAATLIGFTLTNGATVGTDAGEHDDLMGGGVFAAYGTYQAGGPQIISNCWITGNSCLGGMGMEGAGGGAAKGTYFNCRIIGNSTFYYGGGISHSKVVSNCFIAFNTSFNTGGGASQSTLYNCQVISNYARNYGGGIYNCTMYNSVLAYNVANGSYGSAICYTRLSRNCLIYGNRSGNGFGTVYLGNGNMMESCTIVGNWNYGIVQRTSSKITNIILNCIIYSNQAVNWQERDVNSKFMFTNTCTYPVNVGWDASNTTNNPRLVDFGAGYGTDHIAGNYSLQANSPCVNNGLNQDWMTNAVDLDGRKRIRYGTADMGAYELIYDGTIYKYH